MLHCRIKICHVQLNIFLSVLLLYLQNINVNIWKNTLGYQSTWNQIRLYCLYVLHNTRAFKEVLQFLVESPLRAGAAKQIRACSTPFWISWIIKSRSNTVHITETYCMLCYFDPHKRSCENLEYIWILKLNGILRQLGEYLG